MLWKVTYSGTRVYMDFFTACTYDDAIAKASALACNGSYSLELVRV